MFSHALRGNYFLRGQLRTVLGARFVPGVVRCSRFTWPLFSSRPIRVRSAGLLAGAIRCFTLGKFRAVLTIKISCYQIEKRRLRALTSRKDENSQQNWQRCICTQHGDRKGDVERSGYQHGSELKAPLTLHSSICPLLRG